MCELASMSLELQTQHENMDAHIIIIHLKKLFDVDNRTERYETSKKLFHYKIKEGSLVLRMNDYFKKLNQFGFVMDHELSVLKSKHKSLFRP